jgi:hypothetical protein
VKVRRSSSMAERCDHAPHGMSRFIRDINHQPPRLFAGKRDWTCETRQLRSSYIGLMSQQCFEVFAEFCR